MSCDIELCNTTLEMTDISFEKINITLRFIHSNTRALCVFN